VSDNDCFKKTLLENNQNNFLIYIYIYMHLWNIDFTPMYDKKKIQIVSHYDRWKKIDCFIRNLKTVIFLVYKINRNA
jgi:hypothetical protein